MTTNTERDGAEELNLLAMSLLAGMADHAEEAGLGDLALYFMMARTELGLGPWEDAIVEVVPAGRVGFVKGVRTLLDLLDTIRPLTEDPSAVVALALAQLWVVDGVAWLDQAAATVASSCRASTIERRS